VVNEPKPFDLKNAEQRLADTTRYLSSDALEGRGLGTHGINLAADYIAAELRGMGLNTRLWDGGPFQKFSVAIDAEVPTTNHITLNGPADASGKPIEIALELNKDYTPLAISGSGAFDLPVVFAGFGISARKANFDEFADIDVSGKAVIMLRHQPHEDVDDAASAGIKETSYTSFRHKASNAYEHGASAVIFCSDLSEVRKRHGDTDTLLPFHVAGTTFTHPDLPVITCRRAVIDRILATEVKATHQQAAKEKPVAQLLADIEDQIDRTLKPSSRALEGWRIRGTVDIRHVPCEVKNVAAILPGEGPMANEAVIVGAHYDHLGYGSRSTLPSKTGPIYHGADDNASGVADVLEIARMLSQRRHKLHRQVVFVFFTGEEWGFWGSSHYVNHPVVPLDKTVAMLNLDMVGRLRDEKLTINSVGTGTGFAQLIDVLNPNYGFSITKVAGASGRSDQASFYAKRVPNLHFFTGKHPDYHRPTDTFPGLNLTGMRRIANYITEMTVAIANAPDRPEFVSVPMQPRVGDAPLPFLGCICDFTREEPGFPISSVIHGSPADRCGLRGGDVIVKFGKSNIGVADDLDDALQQYAGGEHVRIRVRRATATMTFEAVLDPPRT
jgi:hypothetical protein